MSSPGACLIAGTLPLIVLLTGCASSTDAGSTPEGHVVVGSGSPEDRQEIDASNQHIFQTEQGIVASPTPSPNTQGAPAGKTPTSDSPPAQTPESTPAPTQ